MGREGRGGRKGQEQEGEVEGEREGKGERGIGGRRRASVRD
jgi:hypothetical protein